MFKARELGFIDSSDTVIWRSHLTSLRLIFLICKKKRGLDYITFELISWLKFLFFMAMTISRLILNEIFIDCKRFLKSTLRDHFY